MESDVTSARTGEDEFLVVTAAVQRIRDLAWLKMHAKGGATSPSQMCRRGTRRCK
ncbi:hypothetical protein NKH55_31490 [Mesorhizobium opportunistum]|uniref:hypothetical protein n=1 Tax=Mesorhizobium opportunistum TaxID=593909 RepID=UPI003334CA66